MLNEGWVGFLEVVETSKVYEKVQFELSMLSN